MAEQLPLFRWQKQLEHVRLQGKREELLFRISKLRPHAHKRLALQERVRLLTLQQIELENQLYDRGRGAR